MKILVVIARFGPHAVGGAEMLARLWTERMARRHDVTVATTCARDYQTWADEEPAGEMTHAATGKDGAAALFRTLRFRVPRPRSMRRFNAVSRLAFRFPDNRPLARWWMRQQGPVSPELERWLGAHAGGFDVAILFHYLYYSTWTALPHVAGKALLVPLAHDEPPLALRAYDEVFARATAIATMSDTEEQLIRQRFGDVATCPIERVGAAVEPEQQEPRDDALLEEWAAAASGEVRQAVARNRFALVLGRIAEAKGVRELSIDLTEAERAGEELPAVIVAGPMEIDPAHLAKSRSLHIVPGAVSEPVARSLRRRAVATLHPGPFESLNLAALASIAAGTPPLAHDRSLATCEIVSASGCGAAWSSPSELAARLRECVERPAAQRTSLATRGQQWLRDQHSTAALDERLERVLQIVADACPRRG
jgi:glycosyltransferase involved in cell wall biosynthesis